MIKDGVRIKHGIIKHHPGVIKHGVIKLGVIKHGVIRANPCKNRPKSPIRGKAQKIKIALLLQTGTL